MMMAILLGGHHYPDIFSGETGHMEEELNNTSTLQPRDGGRKRRERWLDHYVDVLMLRRGAHGGQDGLWLTARCLICAAHAIIMIIVKAIRRLSDEQAHVRQNARNSWQMQ